MVVKEYDNVQTFLDDYEGVLLEREAVSQLIIYYAYQKLASNSSEKTIFGSIMEDDKTLLLFSNAQEHNLVLYVVQREKAVAASSILAEFMGNSQITVTGINATQELCQNFIEKYKQHINCNFVQKLGTDIMEIRKVHDIKPVEGNQRLAHQDEARHIADWMIQFQIEALTSELDYEAALIRAKKYIEEDKIYFYEDGNQKVVSMAVAARKLIHGIAITYVFTPEECRGKGYAAANIYYLSKKLLDQGYEFCTLSVDKNNPLSNRAYEKVGYKILEDSYEYKIIPTEVL